MRADVQGSVEAIKSSLEKIDIEGIKINIIRATAGSITQSDVLLASASNAIIYGFNVRPDAAVRQKAEEEKVRDRVIKPLTVRRTRTDIESVPRYNKDVNGFPKVERPVESRYELNEHLANLFERAMQTLDKELAYARYQAIAFLKPEVSIRFF